MTQIRPLKGKLFGQILGGDYKSPGGIYVVTPKKRVALKIKVLSIGRPFESKKGKPQVYRAQPGEIAHIKPREGQLFIQDRKRYLLIENEDITAVETSCVCEHYFPGHFISVKEDGKTCEKCGETMPWREG